MSSDRKDFQSDSANAQPGAQNRPAEDYGDPLLELARIMEEQNAADAAHAAERQGAHPTATPGHVQSPPTGFDDGMSDQMPDPISMADAFDPVDDLEPADLAFDDELVGDVAPFEQDDVLSHLDFSDLAPGVDDSPNPPPPVNEPVSETVAATPPPAFVAPVTPSAHAQPKVTPAEASYTQPPSLPTLEQAAPMPSQEAGPSRVPSLSAYLTPRSTATDDGPDLQKTAQTERVDQALDGDALLAAMDDMVVDDVSEAPIQTGVDQAIDDDIALGDVHPAAVEQQGNSHTGRNMVFGLAGLAVLGLVGVVAYGLFVDNQANDGAPQLIASTITEDDKVEPPVNEEREAQPGDSVFQSLGDDVASDEPRVVLPAPGADGSADAVRSVVPSADIAPAPPGATTVRPVRTVTVRADGSVVETEPLSPEVAAAPVPALTANDVQVEAAEPRPVEIVSITPDTGQVAINPGGVAAAVQSAVETQLQTAQDQPGQATPSAVPPLPVARPTTIAPVQVQPQTQTAVAPTNGTQVQPIQTQPVQTQPIQLAAPAASTAPVQATPAATTPAATTPAATAPAPSGDFIVQLASLRSDEQARSTFSTLQNRFGSILSGFTPNVQRVDLGDRGIYHRLRVGPMDRASADSLCQRYQSAGGDCFVQRQ